MFGQVLIFSHEVAQPVVAQPVRDDRRLIDERRSRVKGGERVVVKRAVAFAKPDLVQAHAGADKHAERPWADLCKKRALVAIGDAVELDALVRDRSGQEIQAPRRTFGVCGGLNTRRQVQPFGQRHHVNAALLEHGAAVEVDAVHFQLTEPRLDRFAVPVPRPRIALILVACLFVTEILIYRWLVPKGGDELTELCVVYCVALSFLYPVNREIFRR